jgi:hypothetical protein
VNGKSKKGDINMNRKGFTLFKLLLVIIFGALFFASNSQSMELNALIPADSENIALMAKAMRVDTTQTVQIVVYAAEWTYDVTDDLVDEGKKVAKSLSKQGIHSSRISILFANKGGLAEDSAPAPAADGIYLYLE